MTTDPQKSAQATSFDRAADTYERARPDYPAEAIDWLLESEPHDVLDLGAGTGKLTRSLQGRAGTIHAVDPSPNMLAQLRSVVPSAQTAVGTAEEIPLDDDSVDAVIGAQMWHWVDQERAVPEVRRVLRPRGVLGLIWNLRDETVAWVAELGRIIQQSEAERFVQTEAPLPADLGDVDRLVVEWNRPFNRAALLDLVASRSYIITATPEVQGRVRTEVEDLLDSHPDLADPTTWTMPYRTEAFRVIID